MEKDYSISKAVLIGAGIGAAAGFLAGVVSHQKYQQHKHLKPSDILETVKQAFDAKEDYEVEGSWIEYNKIPWKEFALETTIYRGGITCKKDGQFYQYEFVADAHTGTIMDIHERIIDC